MRSTVSDQILLTNFTTKDIYTPNTTTTRATVASCSQYPSCPGWQAGQTFIGSDHWLNLLDWSAGIGATPIRIITGANQEVGAALAGDLETAWYGKKKQKTTHTKEKDYIYAHKAGLVAAVTINNKIVITQFSFYFKCTSLAKDLWSFGPNKCLK